MGYHLVVENRGPGRAYDVDVAVYTPRGNQELGLRAVDEEEFPLEVLDSGVQYPVPWALDDETQQREGRRYRVELTWRDARFLGRRRAYSRILMLRRGDVPSVG